MCMAAAMSARLGWLSDAQVERIERLVAAAGLPVRPPAEVAPQRFMELMAVDKKVMDGQLRLVLIRDIGHSVISADFDPDVLRQTLNAA